MAANPFRVRSKVAPVAADALEPGDRLLLEVGPTPRQARRDDWPAEEARRGPVGRPPSRAALAATPGGRRPWAFLRFDVPDPVRAPGATRDALVARGTIHPDDAALQDMTQPRTPHRRRTDGR